MTNRLGSATRRRISLLVAAAVALTLAPVAGATANDDLRAVAEQLFHQRHLETRQDPVGNGVNDHPAAPAIEGHTDLLDTARAWSAQMAADHQLKHNPSLGDDVCCWTKVGENVAYYEGSLSTDEDVRRATEQLMDAWIASSGHRRNIMDADWDQFAVGVAIQNGTMWATTVFRRLDGSTPPGEAYGAEGPGGSREATSTRLTATKRDTTATCAEVDHAGYADSNGKAHDESIKCAAGHGLASGRNSDEYVPAGDVTRAQVMAFLRRAVEKAGHQLDVNAPDYFSDDNGTAHEQSANMLAHAGFVVIADSKLRPNEAATRGFISSVAGRALADLDGLSASGDYFDDDNGHADEAWVNLLAEAGVVTGSADRAFGPDLGLTRAQMATVLVRTFDALR